MFAGPHAWLIELAGIMASYRVAHLLAADRPVLDHAQQSARAASHHWIPSHATVGSHGPLLRGAARLQAGGGEVWVAKRASVVRPHARTAIHPAIVACRLILHRLTIAREEVQARARVGLAIATDAAVVCGPHLITRGIHAELRQQAEDWREQRRRRRLCADGHVVLQPTRGAECSSGCTSQRKLFGASGTDARCRCNVPHAHPCQATHAYF